MTDFDSPWKEVLDHYFEAFLALLFPHIHGDIDWSRGYEMLDKELQKIVPEAEQGRRVVDKLVKVWLKNGEERWILIHIEVQSQREGDFPKRMHVYNYKILDRYDREVVSLAILADDDPGWRPTDFSYGRWGFRTGTVFPIVKLLDFEAQVQELEVNPNPFAVVVLAHLKTLETRQAPENRRTWKLRLVKGLYERGVSAEDVRQLFRFIDWIMVLPKALSSEFRQEIIQYEEEKHMPFMTTPERLARTEELLAAIELGLELKFGAPALHILPEIKDIEEVAVLRAIRDAIRSANCPDDLRRVWAP